MNRPPRLPPRHPQRSVTVWQAVRGPGARRRGRRFAAADLWRSLSVHRAVFWGALALTLAAAALSWVLQRPQVEAQTRLFLEAPQTAAGTRMVARAEQMLASAEARLAALDTVGWRRVFPDLSGADPAGREEAVRRLAHLLDIVPQGRSALLVSFRHGDPEAATALERALVAAVLVGIAPPPLPPATQTPVTSLTGPPEVLTGIRARVAADLAAADRRAAVLSDGLTDTAHDMVATLRATQSADARPPAADLLDQGRVLMAELQLKRLQLASRYQDDFPAVTALDAEIAKLRTFLAGEQKQAAPRNQPSPVLETLAAERRRLAIELDEENARRLSLRSQLATLDQQIAAATPPATKATATPPAPTAPPSSLAAGATVLLALPDPRLLAVPLILAVGIVGAVLLAWAALRSRTVLATRAEAEIVLGAPVLRCLDADGFPVPPIGLFALRKLPIRPTVRSAPHRRSG